MNSGVRTGVIFFPRPYLFVSRYFAKRNWIFLLALCLKLSERHFTGLIRGDMESFTNNN